MNWKCVDLDDYHLDPENAEWVESEDWSYDERSAAQSYIETIDEDGSFGMDHRAEPKFVLVFDVYTKVTAVVRVDAQPMPGYHAAMSHAFDAPDIYQLNPDNMPKPSP